jgi:hypothetical protein
LFLSLLPLRTQGEDYPIRSFIWSGARTHILRSMTERIASRPQWSLESIAALEIGDIVRVRGKRRND